MPPSAAETFSISDCQWVLTLLPGDVGIPTPKRPRPAPRAACTPPGFKLPRSPVALR